MRTHCHRLVALIALVLCASFAAASVTITSTSGNVFYVDTAGNVTPNLLGSYVSYTITNTGAPIADAWVPIGSFTGQYVHIGVNEPGVAHLGPLASGASGTVFFYLNANCSSFQAGKCNVNTQQGFSVNVYAGPPSANLLQSQAFSVTVLDTTAAQANKVNTVVTSTNDPILGSLIIVTETGQTGTIGSGNTFFADPQTTFDFPADRFRLINTDVTFSGGNSGNYDNQLLIPASAFPSSSNTNYSFAATYQVVGTTVASTAVSPVSFIGSGTQIKHTDTSSFATDLPPIPPASNTLTLAKLSSSSVLPTGGIVTYTLRATNAGAADTTLDDFVDTLPAGVSYVAGSSKFAGSTIADPSISSSTLTWSRLFAVLASSSADLTFQATIPNVAGSYTNSAVAHVGSSEIDTTTDTSSNSPATVTSSRLISTELYRSD